MNQANPEPFDLFMERALHHPQTGYYSRRIRDIGRGGDFTTMSAHCGTLAAGITRWATQTMRETGIRNLVELGPGTGQLSADILRRLPLALRLRTRLHLVETSPQLAELQRKQLGRRATWHEHPSSAMNACDGRALVFSNELVDAFPVRRFRWAGNSWIETGVVQLPDGTRAEQDLPETTLPDSTLFPLPFPQGQRIEVHDSYRKWLASWMPAWKAGRMLTIDYGDTAGNLYHRRPNGTLRAYLLHQRLEGNEALQHPGRQDITADVNFSDIIEWTKEWTMDTRLLDLAEFLGPEARTDHLGPDGPGTAFKVLEQARGVA